MLEFDPAEWALLLIDMQRDFCSPGGYADHAGLDIRRLRRPIANQQALLGAARRYQVRVVYTREGHRPDLSDAPPAKLRRAVHAGAPLGGLGPMGRLLVRGEYGQDIIDELRPAPSETVIDKPGYSAFYQTDLELVLRGSGVRYLVLAGACTDLAVASTLRDAAERGFECIVAGDACAARDPEAHSWTLEHIERSRVLGQSWDTAQVVSFWRSQLVAQPELPELAVMM